MGRCRFCDTGGAENNIGYKGYDAPACDECKKKAIKLGNLGFQRLYEDGTLASFVRVKVNTRQCEQCGKVFETKNTRKKYCSDYCGNKKRLSKK